MNKKKTKNSKPKVYWIAGEQDQIDVFGDALKKEFDIKMTTNSEKALVDILESEYDLILSDILIPRKDGFTILSELIKSKYQGEKFRFAFFSNIAGNISIEKAFELGADKYFLMCDTTLEDLVQGVKELLNSKPNLKEYTESVRKIIDRDFESSTPKEENQQPSFIDFSSLLKAGVVLGLIGLVISYIFSFLSSITFPWNSPDQIMEYKGEKIMQVCRVPYYSDLDCVYVPVGSNGDFFVYAELPVYGTVMLFDASCHKKGFSEEKGNNRFFCSAFDIDRQRWDISIP